MVLNNQLRRIDRGLYDQPKINPLSGQESVPDYRSIIDAIGRRDQIKVLPDGMTAANDLGLTNAVAGRVIVHTDGRLRPIVIGKLTLQFKLTAPSKLYWAGRPAMRIVQALYWLRDELKTGTQSDQSMVQTKLIRLLNDAKAKAIRDDLHFGMHTLPAWMQKWIRQLLVQTQQINTEASK
jgi:hypothetical protein